MLTGQLLRRQDRCRRWCCRRPRVDSPQLSTRMAPSVPVLPVRAAVVRRRRRAVEQTYVVVLLRTVDRRGQAQAGDVGRNRCRSRCSSSRVSEPVYGGVGVDAVEAEVACCPSNWCSPGSRHHSRRTRRSCGCAGSCWRRMQSPCHRRVDLVARKLDSAVVEGAGARVLEVHGVPEASCRCA